MDTTAPALPSFRQLAKGVEPRFHDTEPDAKAAARDWLTRTMLR